MSANIASKQRSGIKLGAIIAIYRDGRAIPYMYTRLKDTFEKIGVHYEIIFVNDCSPRQLSRSAGRTG